MSELFKTVEAKFTAFKTKEPNKFDPERKAVSSERLFSFMKKIHTQEISGKKVDELGNTAEAYIIPFEQPVKDLIKLD